MRNIKTLVFIKLLLLVGAIILAGFLIFLNKSPAPVEQSTIIILDVSSGMMTQDISTSKGDFITRLDAAKKIITKIISELPQRTFGLMTYGPEIVYLIPPTLDSGVLLQYSSSLLVSQIGKIPEKSETQRTTGLLESLQDKQLIVLGNVALPKSLLKNAQIIPLATYTSFQPVTTLTRQHVNLSTSQTQWLIIILCLLTVLSL